MGGEETVVFLLTKANSTPKTNKYSTPHATRQILAELQKKEGESAALGREVDALSRDIKQRKKAAEQAGATAGKLEKEEIPGHEAVCMCVRMCVGVFRCYCVSCVCIILVLCVCGGGGRSPCPVLYDPQSKPTTPQ